MTPRALYAQLPRTVRVAVYRAWSMACTIAWGIPVFALLCVLPENGVVHRDASPAMAFLATLTYVWRRPVSDDDIGGAP